MVSSPAGQNFNARTYYIAAGMVDAFTLIVASARVFIKYYRFHRFHADDYLLIASMIFYIATISCAFAAVAPAQLAVETYGNIDTLPEEAIAKIEHYTMLLFSFNVLSAVTLFSVKASFLMFFRLLLNNTGKLKVYWWAVFVVTVAFGLAASLATFIVCPAVGRKIVTVCLASNDGTRNVVVQYLTTGLDILSDILIISIPVLVLYSIKANIRRKIGLGSLLVLSVFCIVCTLIRSLGQVLDDGRVDVIWIIFWLQIELSVALIANSMTAFRLLFLVSGSESNPPVNNEANAHNNQLKRKSDGSKPPGELTMKMQSLLSEDSSDKDMSGRFERTKTSGERSWDSSSAVTELHYAASMEEMREMKRKSMQPANMVSPTELDSAVAH